MNFLDQLNSSQREAVTHTEGPTLIVAGAGSGKTRVLTYRIAYLLQQGVPAGNILALTFTNKAAREMKERICRLVPPDDARYLWMGTFHHVCTRLLRRYGELLGFTRDFTIYDTQDMKSLLKAICKERGLDDKIYKPGAVLERISMAKNMMISPEQYALNSDIQRRDREARMYELATVYKLYQLRLQAANAMDFDDLLLLYNALSLIAYGDNDPRDIELAFMAKMIKLCGYAPTLTSCVKCGRDLRACRQIRFSNSLGGSVCERCGSAFAAYSTLALEALRRMMLLDTSDMRRVRLPDGVREELYALIYNYAEYIFEFTLKR